MTKKQIVLVFCLFIISVSAFSQVEEPVSPGENELKEKVPFGQRLVFGVDFGLSFGSITYIKLAPDVGFRINDRLTAGLGPIYIYQRIKYYDFETSIYGGKTFASFTVYKGSQKQNRLGIGDVMIHAENEVVSVEKYDGDERIWIDNLLLGGGMFQPLGRRFGVSVFVLWDVTQNFYSPYYRSNPVFKFVLNF